MKIIKEHIDREEYNSECLLEMSNLRGKDVVHPNKLPFSFYFSQSTPRHSIRVKPMFNEEKLKRSLTGTLKLCDDWEYTPGEEDKDVSGQDIKEMKQFFRKYLVIFCAVWDVKLQETDAEDYFRGFIDFKELVTSFEFYNDNREILDDVTTIEELEHICRKNELVNFYGNPPIM